MHKQQQQCLYGNTSECQCYPEPSSTQRSYSLEIIEAELIDMPATQKKTQPLICTGDERKRTMQPSLQQFHAATYLPARHKTSIIYIMV
mmetsp:Transcript_9447/g.15802  ORF Transcript_9447/g.15802 Transcript_9447/m.15802 type:complete len:89 (+) Transcript_9447:873-1139(+)